MTTETYTYWVCVDCHMTHHTGEAPDMPEGCEPWSKLEEGQTATSGLLQAEHACGWEDMDRDSEPTCDYECEHVSFSWSDCDGCGSTLGGERFAYTVWEK